MRRTLQGLLIACSFVLLFSPAAVAQVGAIDGSIGFGAAQAKASSTGIDSTTLLSCILPTDSSCLATPALSNFMLGFSGSAIVFGKLGVGAEVNLQPVRQDYLILSSGSNFGEKLQSRLTFYDFNAIYRPVTAKKALLQLEGGIGGVNLKFYDTASSSTTLLGSSTSSSPIGSVNKFQVHGGVGVQIYVKGNFFIRPQFDLHYVPNLDQFGTNLVKRETVWVGYSFGR